jgi:predicted nuclease of restriction endonuclease-like (RecB) superfamily
LERLFDSSFYERRRIGEVAPASALVVRPARSAVPDMYSLEFLDLPERYREANLRDAIVLHLRDFILELGKDFTFVGKEYPVKVGNSDFNIDLLFFNRALRCFFAFELKTRKFRPADIGQIDFYLEALDRDVKKPDENPSVGVILCTDKDDSVVEYALSRSMSPTMVASYQLALPDKDILQNRLRQITELVLEENQIAELPCLEDKDEVS